MDPKLLVCVVILILTLHQQVEADFWYNHVYPKEEELEALDLKCIPGRTIIKMPQDPPSAVGSDESEEYRRRDDILRTYDNENCQICICSAEGKDQDCVKRTTKNLNECVLLSNVVEDYKKNLPFEHERTLAYNIRRDYIWHNDEIPYEKNARCRRGHSYYSNSVNANNTDIDVASDIDSLLDYSNKGVCYYCVCSMAGTSTGCISRNPWFCEYYRMLRDGEASRDIYTSVFQQDRPAYFRSLSWRLRRTMDTGMFDMMESVGNEKEQNCIPFVSQYTDCTEENQCSGCTKCTCSAKKEWDCETIKDCPGEEKDIDNMNDDELEEALEVIQNKIREQEMSDQAASNSPLVPAPDGTEDLLLELKETDMEDEILKLFRSKRSIDQENKLNKTVKFHHVVDEVNEDTLNSSTVYGTITAKKIDVLPHITRRAGNNTSNALQIEYTKPQEYSHHDDNKVDTTAIHDDKEDLLIHSKIFNVIGNSSQMARDKEISKIVVNELKKGTEIIGDESAPVISNITFTPANETLAAIVFIAGNLMNRLWNMEKDSNDDISETELLKHEKITELLDLFKEPLLLRQEIFLRTALQQLTTALNKNENVENGFLCNKLKQVQEQIMSNENYKENNEGKTDCNKKKNTKTIPNSGNVEALNKLNNVLDLIKRYEHTQNTLKTFKSQNKNDSRKFNADFQHTTETKNPLDFYGTILEALTKLLTPNKKNKKLIESIHNHNIFTTRQDIKSELKLGDLNVTTKDRIVLDYLNHIQSNPKCLLKKHDKISHNSIEGNILLNLSEFLKIKSLSDFIKLVDTGNRVSLRPQDITTRKTLKEPVEIPKKKDEKSKQLANIKQKLKEHLKSILKDIIEMQNLEGKAVKSPDDIQIMDVLPCIYNIMNTDQEKNQRNNLNISPLTQSKKKITNPTEKLREIFDNLKKELKFAQTRRVNKPNGPRPKSAVVWERIIKNVDRKQKKNTRRNLINSPISVTEVKDLINKMDSAGSNTYKNYAYLYEVPSAERLLVLKTFHADTVRIIGALSKIDISLQINPEEFNDIYKDLSEFVDNVATNVNLNEKVVRHLDRTKYINTGGSAFNRHRQTYNKDELKQVKPSIRGITALSSKLTKDQIINQIIKNRVLLYVQTKEATGETNHGDINYALAKKILLHLDMKNYVLARELYKIFASQRQNDTTNADNIGLLKDSSLKYNPRQTPLHFEPLIQFEDRKNTNKGSHMNNQDNFIKQLLNLNNANK